MNITESRECERRESYGLASYLTYHRGTSSCLANTVLELRPSEQDIGYVDIGFQQEPPKSFKELTLPTQECD